MIGMIFTSTWDVYITFVNNGINYQPQLVSQISSAVWVCLISFCLMKVCVSWKAAGRGLRNF